jgi:hypothetical protein
LADIHGWKSERVEAGKAAREKIKVARAALAAMKVKEGGENNETAKRT